MKLGPRPCRRWKTLSGTLLVLTALPAWSAPGSASNEADKTIAALRQITVDLNDAVKRFQTDLDREVALHDRGYRAPNGRRIQGADVDFIGGPADIAQLTIRKLFAARMIAARRPGYAPPPLTDYDRIVRLITEARGHINAGNDTMRTRLNDLQKARVAASEAAKKALLALPVALPEGDTAEEQREKAWELMLAGRPVESEKDGPHGGGKANSMPGAGPKQDTRPEDAALPAVLPIHFEEGKRITLVNEHFCRVMLTDAGMEDDQGRHLFYEEEWVWRPGNMDTTGWAGFSLLMRWAVAVNTTTGQHSMLRRYESLKFTGDLGALYRLQKSDDVQNVEIPDRSSPPSMQELTSAVLSVDRSREELHDAILEFKRQVRDALRRSDALLASHEKTPLDDDIENDLREKLFAIRGHLAGTGAILDAENKLRRAVERSDGKARDLEGLVAWMNGNALEREDAPKETRGLLDTLNRADAGIRQTRNLEREARACLPPNVPTPEAQFPELKKNTIVRIRKLRGPTGDTVRCRQEIWHLTIFGNVGDVKRTIVTIDIDVRTGNQAPVDREVRHYAAEPGETLEEVYDENAAQ